MAEKPDEPAQHGVPAGAAKEESKGGPESGRLESETAPLQPEGGKSE